MSFQIEINQRLVTVQLEKRKNIKHVYLRVLKPDLIQIKTNIYYTLYDAKDLIEKKMTWIENSIIRLEEKSINEDLRSFNQVAYETKFKKENIIATDYYDDKKTIDINTKSANFSIEKPNTPTYANDIFELSNNSDLNNPDSLNAVKNKVQTSLNELQNSSDKFNQFGNTLQTTAKETIKEQVDLYNENKINKDRNFGQDSTDFSKTNVSTNMGYLAASQANIVQAQSVRLLS